MPSPADAVTKASARHIAPLDGLRGIAVLVVVAFHFSWAFADTHAPSRLAKHVLWTGWVGVDLFFVLSGYLITRGLVAPSDRPLGERLKLFWGRRFLRIFPLYYLVLLLGTLLCLYAGARVPDWTYWAYVQNYALAFDPDPERWTSHLWSLAVEEQFYLVWPLVALSLPRKQLERVAIALLVLGCLFRCGFVLAGGATGWDAFTRVKLAYRATPTHMDGLLVGALLAIAERRPEGFFARAWARFHVPVTVVSGIALLGLALMTRGFEYQDRRVVVLGYPLLAFFFGGLLSTAIAGARAEGRSPAARFAHLLTSSPLRACGRVSYGMYIFHWPAVAALLPFFKSFPPTLGPAAGLAFGVATVAVAMIVTYFAAEASFRFFEMPFLKLKERLHE